jgi:site-specific DNA-adenine methylase
LNSKHKMTVIYCVKCQEKTNTKSEKMTITANRHNRLAGICTVCNTKKGMFVNSQGKIVKKTPEEIEEAEFKKIERQQKKEALKIGWKVLRDSETKECVKNCFAKARK